jgi:hypothetical protein
MNIIETEQMQNLCEMTGMDTPEAAEFIYGLLYKFGYRISDATFMF